ncbi:FAD-dependent oxidoreductase [Virgibacillus xinjiangensis]|uniref:FAD-dependent oxidoreductase n=1 Tax=Virgibacillus xinjiangensis TaxID=393090 RepID=A0ABV7CRF4_9BACI
MEDHQLPNNPETYWRDSIELPTFPPLEESISVDVAIAGAGITGITAAYLLSSQNIKVAVLDADQILNGTTGHTTAKITAQHGLIYDEFIQHFGEEVASKYYQAAEEAKELIKQNIEKHQIECDFQTEDAYIYTNEDSYVQQLQKEKEAYDKLGIPGELTDHLPLNLAVKSALMMKNQAQFHPLKYLKALTELCIEQGVKFYENTVATDVEYNNQPAILTKDGHRITCKNIIAATHFPFQDKRGLYFARMYAERAYVLGIKTSQKYPGGMYINAESPTRSIRSTTFNGEKLWLISGENHKTGQGKPTMEHYNALQAFSEENFDMEEVVYRWSAQDLTTLDKIPYVGSLEKDQDHILIATGYRKWGMTNGTIAAKILTDKILKKENAYAEIYQPSRFKGHPGIREFAQINADVVKHMVRGKMEQRERKIDELLADDAAVIRINGQRAGAYKDKEENLHVVDTTCTHMGCEVEWNSGDRTWDCPCHGSRFSYTGDVIEGPAQKPLKKIDP